MLCTPLYPMVLLIIIPIKNGYFLGNIPYFQTHPYINTIHNCSDWRSKWRARWVVDIEIISLRAWRCLARDLDSWRIHCQLFTRSQDTPKTLPRLPMCSNMFKHVQTCSNTLDVNLEMKLEGRFKRIPATIKHYQTFVPAFLMFQKITPINAMPKTPTFGNLSWGEKNVSECWVLTVSRAAGVLLVFQRRSLVRVEFANCLVVDICASKTWATWDDRNLSISLKCTFNFTFNFNINIKIDDNDNDKNKNSVVMKTAAAIACHHLQHKPV